MGVQLREDRWSVFTQAVDLASVAANTAADQNITIPGLKVGDLCLAAAGLGGTAGLSFAGGRVSAVDTLTLRCINNTGSAIDQASVSIVFVMLRPEKVDNGLNFG